MISFYLIVTWHNKNFALSIFQRASVVINEHFFQAAEVCIKYGADTCALQVRLSLALSLACSGLLRRAKKRGKREKKTRED